MLMLPLIVFWVIILVAWDDLGWRGGVTCIVVWAGLLAGCRFLHLSSYVFVAVQALFDVILWMILFKGDIRIR
jgi:hypothetical protein